MSWSEYTSAARELAELRRRDAAELAERTEATTTAERDLERLSAHLTAQQKMLVGLAKALRLPEPWFGGKVEPSSVTDLPQALHRAADAANAADAEARRAEESAARPILLPTASPTVRNVVIYGAWAMVGWLLQCGLALYSNESDFGVLAWSLCGLPALAFFAGYLTVSTLGQPRVGSSYPKQTRLGGAICFGGMVLAWLALIALLSFLRG